MIAAFAKPRHFPLEGDLPGSEAGKVYAELAQEVLRRHAGGGQILISSPEGGGGRTTTASNLSLALLGKGVSVLLLEMTDAAPKMEAIFGASPYRSGTESVLAGKHTIDSVICRRTDNGLYLAVMKAAVPLDLQSAERLQRVDELLHYARSRFDWTVIDGPSGADEASLIALAGTVSQVIVVCHRRRTRAAALASTLSLLQAYAPYVLLTK